MYIYSPDKVEFYYLVPTFKYVASFEIRLYSFGQNLIVPNTRIYRLDARAVKRIRVCVEDLNMVVVY